MTSKATPMEYVETLMGIALECPSHLNTLPTNRDSHKKYKKCKSDEGVFKVTSARPSSKKTDYKKTFIFR